jgi:6-pyruvoyltetrahydropterin/6-carboxytetrahydropterin synthase
MPGPALYRIVLAKEDFKFSVAHFTLFGGGRAELLHGHNYRVGLELAGSGLDEQGLLVDIERPKRAVRALCARLDSRTLLPAASPGLALAERDGGVEVRFGPRRYLFPAADVLALPLANTSMELLARMFWDELAGGLAGTRVERLAVSVEETDGQRCVYEAALPSPQP